MFRPFRRSTRPPSAAARSNVELRAADREVGDRGPPARPAEGRARPDAGLLVRRRRSTRPASSTSAPAPASAWRVPLFSRNQGEIAGSRRPSTTRRGPAATRSAPAVEATRLRRRSSGSRRSGRRWRRTGRRSCRPPRRSRRSPRRATASGAEPDPGRARRAAQPARREVRVPAGAAGAPGGPRRPGGRCLVDRSSSRLRSGVASPGARAPSPCSRPVVQPVRRATRRSRRPRCRRSRPRSAASCERDLVEPLVVRGTVAALPNEDVKRRRAGRRPRGSPARSPRATAVRAGQVVAEIDPRAARGPAPAGARPRWRRPRPRSRTRRLNLDRTERLFERGIAAGKEVEDARAQARGRRGGRRAGRGRPRHGRPPARRARRSTSPIAGQVVKRLVERRRAGGRHGRRSRSSRSRTSIASSSPPHVPAEHLGRVHVGQHGAIVVGRLRRAGRSTGEVIAIAPAVDPATNAALVRIRVANPERLLKVGMFAAGPHRRSASRRARSSCRPRRVRKSDEGAAVYVVSGDQATRTPVKIGLETPEAVEILSGVERRPDGPRSPASTASARGRSSRDRRDERRPLRRAATAAPSCSASSCSRRPASTR